MSRTPAADRLEEMAREVERLRLAILDIDAHATPLGEDDEGFVAVGYAVSVGSLHRALGVVGHSAPKGVTRVDMEPDFIAMLYALVPEGIGIPIGASALIWRAARELEALGALRPLCPTCGGKRHATNGSVTNGIDPCPDCVDGHVTWQWLVNVFNAVWGDKPPAHSDDVCRGVRLAYRELRSIR